MDEKRLSLPVFYDIRFKACGRQRGLKGVFYVQKEASFDIHLFFLLSYFLSLLCFFNKKNCAGGRSLLLSVS